MIILLAHATDDVRALYEQATGARVVPFTSPFPGMSAAYDALAASLGRPLLPRLLARLKVTPAPGEPIVFAWWSGGYAMARALAQDPESRARIAAWVGLDGIHTSREADGTPSDAGVAWAVVLARAALAGGAPVVLAHTDVRTYGTVTSTTDSTREVLRLLDIPPAEWPRTEGTPRPRVAARTWGRLVVAAYDTAAEDLKEHIAALRSWGPSLVADAIAQLGGAVPAPPAAPTGPRTLRRGMSGEDVRELQRLLGAAGFVLARDGLYGPATESAVREYQEERGLTADGLAGPATMASLRGVDAEDTQPGVIPFVQAKNYYAGRQRPIRLVVLHTAEIAEVGNAAENLAAWASGPNAPMASWHYCVDNDSAIQCVREEDTAFAAPGANADGIQIEVSGRASQGVSGWADAYTQAVLARTARIVADVCRRHALPVAFVDAAGLLRGERGITTHAAVTAAYKQSTHTDPGAAFPMAAFLEMVRS